VSWSGEDGSGDQGGMNEISAGKSWGHSRRIAAGSESISDSRHGS
jgi:hypothetical protein